MSDLEGENRDGSDREETVWRSEDQMSVFLDCAADMLCHTRKQYEAIQIPGELNTRVRAAIESDRQRKRHRFFGLAGTGAAAVIGTCFLMSRMGMLSNQQTEFTDPSRNMVSYPETKEDVTAIQTTSEIETIMETMMETEESAQKRESNQTKASKDEADTERNAALEGGMEYEKRDKN